jgi:hypothetical protein
MRRRRSDGAMVERFLETEDIMSRRTIKIVHEGRYAAEIPVELVEEEGGWAPYLSVHDAIKLDTVRKALQEGDITTAAKHGRLFQLLPVSA